MPSRPDHISPQGAIAKVEQTITRQLLRIKTPTAHGRGADRARELPRVAERNAGRPAGEG